MAETDRSRLADFVYWIAVAGVVIAAGGILGVQIGLWPPLVAFAGFVLGTLVCGSIAMLVGAVSILRTRRRFGAPARRRSVVGTCVGLALVALVLLSSMSGSGKPPINDISTDLIDPPSYASASEVPAYENRDMSYPEAFAAIVEAAYPDVDPIRLRAPADEAYDRALASASSLGWTITYRDPVAGTFDATDTSAVFRFVDDVTVRVRPDGDGSRIDVRSKSRDGRGDLGANADRIQRFAAEIRLPPPVASR